MNTPRIGDTVHYTRRGPGATPPRCLAAIVTDHSERDGQLTLYAIDTRDDRETPATRVRTTVNYDTDGAIIDTDGDTYASFGGFTPGTWHHLH